MVEPFVSPFPYSIDEDLSSDFEVTISRPFTIGEYEVSQAERVALMETNPSRFKDRKRPVEQVSFGDRVADLVFRVVREIEP